MSPKLKLALSIVGSLVVIAGISIGTILLLNHFKSTVKEEPAATTTLKTVSEPEKLINDYRTTTIAGRTENYNERKKAEVQTDETINKVDSAPNTLLPTNTTIVYKGDDSKYQTRVNVQDNAQYERKDKDTKTNDDSVKNSTETFLVNQGLVRTKDQIKLNGLVYTTYDSANVVCQISDFDSTVYGIATYGVACVSKSLVTEQYKTVDDLLALYKPSRSPGTPTKVFTSTVITENNKKFITLTVSYSGTTSTSLIFAAIDGTWEFIGERAIPNPDEPKSFVMSDDLKNAINDPKWGTFLKDNIR